MSVGAAQELPEVSQQTGAEIIRRPRVWRVVSTIANEDPDVVERASGIPSYGAAHPSKSGLYVTDIDVKQDSSNRNIWTVTATYEGYRTGGEWGNDERVAPLDMRPTVVRMTQKSAEQIDTNVYGAAITNSSGEDYDPPPTADRSRIIYQISRYVAQPRDDIYAEYMDAVNSDSWRPYTSTVTYPPWTVRVDDIQCEQVHVQQYSVFREAWTFIVWYGLPNGNAPGGYNGHMLRIADQGTRTWTWNADEQIWEVSTIKDDDGEPVTTAVPLDGNGSPLNANPSLIAQGIATVWRHHIIYEPKPFGYLNLG